MKSKMKTYVITLSQNFPATHPKFGQKTYFRDKLEQARIIQFDCGDNIVINSRGLIKLHTIRANYPLWKKRFEQIERGEACISIRQWTGKPYASKQIEICRLSALDKIGIQMLAFDNNDIEQFSISGSKKVYSWSLEDLARNDGLTFIDWLDWFKGYDLSKPMAIIQFTKFRY